MSQDKILEFLQTHKKHKYTQSDISKSTNICTSNVSKQIRTLMIKKLVKKDVIYNGRWHNIYYL